MTREAFEKAKEVIKNIDDLRRTKEQLQYDSAVIRIAYDGGYSVIVPDFFQEEMNKFRNEKLEEFKEIVDQQIGSLEYELKQL